MLKTRFANIFLIFFVFRVLHLGRFIFRTSKILDVFNFGRGLCQKLKTSEFFGVQMIKRPKFKTSIFVLNTKNIKKVLKNAFFFSSFRPL